MCACAAANLPALRPMHIAAEKKSEVNAPSLLQLILLYKHCAGLMTAQHPASFSNARRTGGGGPWPFLAAGSGVESALALPATHKLLHMLRCNCCMHLCTESSVHYPCNACLEVERSWGCTIHAAGPAASGLKSTSYTATSAVFVGRGSSAYIASSTT